MEQMLDEFCATFLKLHAKRCPMVVVTMVAHRGGAPQDSGARMIVGDEGILFGTIGGGRIEKRCLDEAALLLGSPERIVPMMKTWNLQTDIGMSCGGEVSVFFESFKPLKSWQVAIFGAGHVSQELVPLLLKLDCYLTVIDPREEWLAKLPPVSSRARYLCRSSMEEVVSELPADTFIALMTMGHSTDLPILRKALGERQFPFVGVIGSQQKRNRLEKELARKDFHCPLGEPFGNNSPIEIALSMVAQLLKERDRHFSSAS